MRALFVGEVACSAPATVKPNDRMAHVPAELEEFKSGFAPASSFCSLAVFSIVVRNHNYLVCLQIDIVGLKRRARSLEAPSSSARASDERKKGYI